MSAPALHPDAEFNDIGNAERVMNYFWQRIAFVPELGKWRHWTGKRWIDDDDQAICYAQTVTNDVARLAGARFVSAAVPYRSLRTRCGSSWYAEVRAMGRFPLPPHYGGRAVT